MTIVKANPVVTRPGIKSQRSHGDNQFTITSTNLLIVRTSRGWAAAVSKAASLLHSVPHAAVQLPTSDI